MAPDNAPTVTPRRRWGLMLLGLSWGLAAFASAIPALMSAMMFDAPGSERAILIWISFLSVATFPAVAAVAAIMCFVHARPTTNRARRLGLIFVALPLANIALMLIAFWLIEDVCGGSFVC